jgi:hypothetical protein
MKMFVNMLAPIAALLAALAGIMGEAWDKHKSGWRRLKVNGWVIAGVAIVSFAASIYQVRQAAISEEMQRAKDAVIRKAASGEINDAVAEILRPFKLAFDAEKYKMKQQGDVLDTFISTPIENLNRIGSPDFLNTLSTIPALACPPQFGNNATCHWADLFVVSAERGDRDLLEIINRYSGVLDAKTLNLVSELRQHKMLNILKSAAGNLEMNQQMGNQVGDVTMGWLLLGPHEPTEYYVPFFKIIRELVNVSNKLGGVPIPALEKSSPPTIRSNSSNAPKEMPQQKAPGGQNIKQKRDTSQSSLRSGHLPEVENDADALKQLRSNAGRGDAKAQVELAFRYDAGNGVPRDQVEALKWFRLSAQQGNATAQGVLGVVYAGGQGVVQDYTEAAKWFRLCAAQANALCQYSLGVLYDDGQIGVQDSKEAMKWYRLSAAQGYDKAFFNLGVIYDKGQGVKQDYVVARMWFAFAARSSQSEVRRAAQELYARVTAKMTSEQIIQANALATKCESSKFKDCG